MSAWLEADWPAPAGVRALTTTRHGLGVSRPPFDAFNLGTRCGDDPAAVTENRRQLDAALRLPSPPRWLRQVHGIAVVPEPGFDEPEADAAVTAEAGVVLAILTADCLPVVFAARDGREIAAAHAGWRGLANGVLETTLAAMRTPAREVIAWLGPAAGPQAYEIGEEVYDAFASRDPRAPTRLRRVMWARCGWWMRASPRPRSTAVACARSPTRSASFRTVATSAAAGSRPWPGSCPQPAEAASAAASSQASLRAFGWRLRACSARDAAARSG